MTYRLIEGTTMGMALRIIEMPVYKEDMWSCEEYRKLTADELAAIAQYIQAYLRIEPKDETDDYA